MNASFCFMTAMKWLDNGSKRLEKEFARLNDSLMKLTRAPIHLDDRILSFPTAFISRYRHFQLDG